MYVAIFIVAVLVSLVLDRQEKRHRFEKRMEYERLGMPMPRSKPRIAVLESVLNIVLGILIAAGSVFAIIAGLAASHALAERHPGISPDVQNLEFFSVGVAVGLVLIILGSIALRRNIVYRRSLRS